MHTFHFFRRMCSKKPSTTDTTVNEIDEIPMAKLKRLSNDIEEKVTSAIYEDIQDLPYESLRNKKNIQIYGNILYTPSIVHKYTTVVCLYLFLDYINLCTNQILNNVFFYMLQGYISPTCTLHRNICIIFKKKIV